MKQVGFLFVAVLAIGCDSLASSPGDEFRVVVSKPEVNVVQPTGAYDLEFSMGGCEDFVATINVVGGGREVLEPKSLGQGRFAASIPVETLRRNDDACFYDAVNPQVSGATLEVTCRQDGRTTLTNFGVRYAPVWRASRRARGPADAVFAGATAGQYYAVGSGWLDEVRTNVRGGEAIAGIAPGTPRLTASSDVVHLWSDCPINDCGMFWFVDTPERKVGQNAGIVQAFTATAEGLRFDRNITAPGDGVDFIREGNASVLVSRASGGSQTALTRFVDASASVIALLDGESALTKIAMLDGTNVFLSQVGSDRARLRRTDGTLVAEVALPGSGEIEHASLAPTGDAWVVVRGGQAWISTFDRGSLGATSALLATELANLVGQSAEDAAFGSAWTSSGIALRNATGAQMFSRSAPFASQWRVATARPNVRGAVGVGESLVLLTASGVQFFDSAGKAAGGADPIAPVCALDFYQRHLAVIGPDTVVLAGSQATYELKVGDPAIGALPK